MEQLVIVKRPETGIVTIRPLVKDYGPMDRTLLEQECAEVFEEVFKDFLLTHVLFHKLDRDKLDSFTTVHEWGSVEL